MNKTELVTKVAEKTNLTKKDTELAVNALIDAIGEELQKKNGKVQLIGFGTFEVKSRKARQGRNPQNPDQVVKIPATKAPVFRAGKALKDRVNKKKSK